jgi:prepilin signal peptidase PulO-like enzyme (type II secretory pathway)
MGNIEDATIVFSIIFIALNLACWKLSQDWLPFCIIFSIFCLSMVGSVASEMQTPGSGAIFTGLMLIFGVGTAIAILFKFMDLIRVMMDKMKDYRI